MPEYLAPGVFVEEVSFRAKTIEGVSTTTTGFIGPARTGPVHLEPDIVTRDLDVVVTRERPTNRVVKGKGYRLGRIDADSCGHGSR